MNKKISFEGIGELVATFYAGEGVKMGQTVKVSGDSTVAPCAAGEKFCGVAVTEPRGGCVGVQVGGMAQVKCADGGVTVGYVNLTADGNGGVKAASGSDKGCEYLVVADDGAGTITIKM